MSIVEIPDDDMSSQLEAVLTERKQQPGDAAGLNAEVEAALLDGVDPVNPPLGALPGLLDRIHKTDRMTHLAPQLAELYDLSLDGALALINQLRRPGDWVEGPATGVRLLPVQTGPRVGEALAAVVYMEAGTEFPAHPHMGTEKVLVLEGAYRESTGEEYWRGELHESAPGTEHSFRAIGGIPCICAGLTAVYPEDP